MTHSRIRPGEKSDRRRWVGHPFAFNAARNPEGYFYHGVVRQTAPATHEESADLADELTRIGYRLVPVCRASPRLHERRLEEARRYRTASPPA
jgi:hypothetical protein